MIVVCPACATRFRVAATALGGAAGRRLRCANCGELWHYQPEPAPDAPAPTETGRLPSPHEAAARAALDRAAAADRPRPQPTPRRDTPAPILRAETPSVPLLDAPSARIAPRPPTGRLRVRRRWPLAVPLGLAALAAALLLAGFFIRHRLAAVWPAIGHPLAAAAVAPAANTGLKVTLSPKRTDGSLVIDGVIVNHAAIPRPVPRLRVTLRDRHEAALASQVIDPPVHQLAPGASAHFNAVFRHPSDAAIGVAVTFATD